MMARPSVASRRMLDRIPTPGSILTGCPGVAAAKVSEKKQGRIVALGLNPQRPQVCRGSTPGSDIMPYTFSRATLPIALLTLTLFGAALSSQSGAHRISNAVPDIARPLPLGAVRLMGGPLKQAQDLDAKYLLALEPDRMLAFYRKRAGLEPKAPPYGGWDGDDRNLTGHIAGHHLSAISIMWQATGDARFKQRVDYMVSELKAVQDKHGDGYLSALAEIG